MASPNRNAHTFPKYRWIENGHIFLWLIKDTCWALEYKVGGVLMIFPTIIVAFYILWKSWNVRSEVFHNGAVCIWIIANSAWMIGEFLLHDTRPVAATLFALGLVLLIYYYLRFFKKDQQLLQKKNTAPISQKETPQPAYADAED
ncbi:MAG TPA: hypothetical protein PL009_09405 [Flavipsychrobacter sp.]|nr:hypothetical protein [Flavipsychrobacter sp.]